MKALPIFWLYQSRIASFYQISNLLVIHFADHPTTNFQATELKQLPALLGIQGWHYNEGHRPTGCRMRLVCRTVARAQTSENSQHGSPPQVVLLEPCDKSLEVASLGPKLHHPLPGSLQP